MAWDVIQSIWPVFAAMGALAVLAFLRLLAVDHCNLIHEYEARRIAAKIRCEHEARRLDRIRQRPPPRY